MQIPTGGLNSLIDPYDPSTADSKSSRAPVRKDTCQVLTKVMPGWQFAMWLLGIQCWSAARFHQQSNYSPVFSSHRAFRTKSSKISLHVLLHLSPMHCSPEATFARCASKSWKWKAPLWLLPTLQFLLTRRGRPICGVCSTQSEASRPQEIHHQSFATVVQTDSDGRFSFWSYIKSLKDGNTVPASMLEACTLLPTLNPLTCLRGKCTVAEGCLYCHYEHDRHQS